MSEYTPSKRAGDVTEVDTGPQLIRAGDVTEVDADPQLIRAGDVTELTTPRIMKQHFILMRIPDS